MKTHGVWIIREEISKRLWKVECTACDSYFDMTTYGIKRTTRPPKSCPNCKKKPHAFKKWPRNINGFAIQPKK